MIRKRLVLTIIPCGKAKLHHPAEAWRLYTGRPFRANWTWGTSVGDVLILSAKHGLLDPTTVIAPYDVAMAEVYGTDQEPVIVRGRWPFLGFANRYVPEYERVIVLGGDLYRRVALTAWPHAECPLVGVGAIGLMIKKLTTNLGVMPERWV